MFQILSETQLRRRFQLRRWQMLALFAGGIVCGSWLDQGGGWPPAAEAAEPVSISSCDGTLPARSTLKLECSLSSSR